VPLFLPAVLTSDNEFGRPGADMTAGFELGSDPAGCEPSRRDEFLASLDWTITEARNSLLALQNGRGYWNAALEAPAQMNAEFIIFNHFMGSVDHELESRIAKFLLDSQQPDGSWNLFPGGEGYASYTIEAYAALKLAGVDPSDDAMVNARHWIISNGGIARAGTLARFYLASIGLMPWSATAMSPVELMLFPDWFPINIYELGSWARGTFVALALLQSAKPSRPVSDRNLLEELYLESPQETDFAQAAGEHRWSLRSIFKHVDRGLRIYDRHPLHPLRARAAQHAEKWLLDHQEENGSFGGIEPCYLLTPMALSAIGYSREHPVIRKALKASRELVWEMGDKALYMPCVSPNWNTALACKAMLASGIPGDHPAIMKAGDWFLDHQIFEPGDWSIKRPDLKPGGWSFEFFNNAYPDVDDSALIVAILSATRHEDPSAKARAIEAGANWVMGMQSGDGGFAAFDVDNDSKWLNRLPLADVEAVTDPSCPDLTGRVLEMLGALHYPKEHPVASRAIEWLRRNQSPEGSWWGRWGVNHIYGTFSALLGLRAIGVDLQEPWIRRAVEWLNSKQNDDGGWGESCLSDKDPTLWGRGSSTASQTAWALIGLIAGETGVSENVTRGVRWLTERQNSAGSWDECEFTGNGFPNHFYMRYYLYPHYFPLLALGNFRSRLAEIEGSPVGHRFELSGGELMRIRKSALPES
jgi:squalene-hopene/tetraprenyl-beta-curcumene cyclase